MAMPKKFPICAAKISSAAPAVKPTTTVCEMKFTRAPMRARPIASCRRRSGKSGSARA